MDRDLAFCALALSVCGALSLLAGTFRFSPLRDPSGQELERRSWRRLWAPLVPASLSLVLLIGWALQEPQRTDEIVKPLALMTSLPVAIIWLRAAWRAVRALRRSDQDLTAMAVGLFRPRVLISEALRRAIDGPALDAALAHEQAHVRHHDPLRVWLAQIATDLQWPARAAGGRMDDWASALELARDEEARRAGIRGDDLASAIVGAARLQRAAAGPCAAASLTGQESTLLTRIHRLLRPLAALPAPARGRPLWFLVVAAALGAGAVVGMAYGDTFVRALPIVAS
ncbi:MAG TPA: M56 family metallopeptidase [Polyangia bacterium]|nr:M56 family metallopeptidase [Polyangia bacterium]